MQKIESPIQVTKSFLPPFNEYAQEIERIWNSSWLTNNGQIHQEFEDNVRKYLGVQNVSLLVNGHLALETAIKSLGITGEIITTPFTFASTAHAISNAGLTPVFCDIDRTNYNLDVNKLESLITDKTTAIMPVHVFGNPCDIKKIDQIAKKHNLKVIYDAAHAFGVEIDDVGIGNFGDVTMFSLHATKVFHSIEGGILAYNNQKLKKDIDLFKNFGIEGPEKVKLVGINAKMNEFQAAMGLVNLRYIEGEIKKRKVIAEHYRGRLKEIGGIICLQDIEGVKHNYAYFPILVDEQIVGINRDTLHEKLKEFNIFTRKYFYPLCTDFDCYAHIDNKHLINAKIIAQQVMTLPIYSGLSVEIIDYICDAIKSIVSNYK
ncbi:DegT/DnrJ/EryC1/StrS family aminotransferase [Paenibacillus alvei]|uniref:DegT/DnrJ/EryC1/StrS family aminotransferase n=1 Tax=Paenibacillus alvei TaxID=44250 RepID=A0AAP7A152_PAEAL|nr:DegT/DnrJ/EryC1/StrS family aminotransferase [Paenibacillus alvei]NOJ73714.1 DegT/DnrJ/EryC1/StrS family aminotransferase [Paenibacillus alvei]